MENGVKIQLDEYKSKSAVTADDRLNIDLFRDGKLLPYDEYTDIVDRYKQYTKEKDASNKYRFSFVINPICSNVLFNAITEIVMDEGSDDCKFFGDTEYKGKDISALNDYLNYTKRNNSDNINDFLCRKSMIRDTGYSHPKCGKIVYHCGYDIFNNLTFRNKEFYVVNKMSTKVTEKDKRIKFNTIEDITRDRDGYEKKYSNTSDYLRGDSLINVIDYDTTYSYDEAIDNNLTEKDGWFGFLNKVNIEIYNYVHGEINEIINKTMNNNKACEMIDMYPDRSLFSFIPKVNKYRHRVEPNWNFLLTYPYENYTDNYLVETQDVNRINGLKGEIVTKMYNDDGTLRLSDGDFVYIRTYTRNNLSVGDEITVTIMNSDGSAENIPSSCEIVTIGLNDDKEHYFSIYFSDIVAYSEKVSKCKELRIRKYKMGSECTYYFRKFKGVPNFKNTDVYQDGNVTDAEIDKYCGRGFGMEANKVAFGETIYADKFAQVIPEDTVDMTGLKDNLGRDLHEVFFTVVKENKGYDKWYNVSPEYSSSDITYSHCFGPVTSGIDLPEYAYDSNIHKINNVYKFADKSILPEIKYVLNFTTDPYNLENDNGYITKDGDSVFSGKCEFFGDIIEYSPQEVEETVLEDVYFRFNTMQREYSKNTEYHDLFYQEADLEQNGDGKGDHTVFKEQRYNTDGNYPANIFPEGYYYKAHYRIPINEFGDINEGYNTFVSVSGISKSKSGGTYTYTMNTGGVNYYFETGDTVYMYKDEWLSDNRAKVVTGTVIGVSGTEHDVITYTADEDIMSSGGKLDYVIFRENPIKPANAVEIGDGSGKYLWRDIKSSSEILYGSELFNSVFVNGCHYFNRNINFFLRRQDPYGDYGLQFTDNAPEHATNLIISGKSADVDSYEYTDEEEYEGCTNMQ